jgi:hypothetical protein
MERKWPRGGRRSRLLLSLTRLVSRVRLILDHLASPIRLCWNPKRGPINSQDHHQLLPVLRFRAPSNYISILSMVVAYTTGGWLSQRRQDHDGDLVNDDSNPSPALPENNDTLAVIFTWLSDVADVMCCAATC